MDIEQPLHHAEHQIHLRRPGPAEYLRRSQYLEVGAVARLFLRTESQTPMFHSPSPNSGAYSAALPPGPLQETNPGRVEHLQGYFTAASGSVIYNGDAAKPIAVNFHRDVSANLVRRETLNPTASRSCPNPPKTAPSSSPPRTCGSAQPLRQCPDGKFYVLDMYRGTSNGIHPGRDQKGLNFWSGDDKGRIYRLKSSNKAAPQRPARPKCPPPNSWNCSEETNGWHRDTATACLRTPGQIGRAAAGRHGRRLQMPQARLRALWLLKVSALQARK
jgi:hypothetical protein